jgi:outer membrane protein assembly factor BamB
MHWFPRALLALIACWLLTASTLGQDATNLRGDSGQTRKRLAEAEQKLLAGKAADATDDLQRILDEASNDLITLDGKQYRPAYIVVHQILSRLPPAALESYREQIDAPARKLLEQARATRSRKPLHQLIDRYFVSRPTEDGLLLLGDLLFEEGNFRTAGQTWQRLTPDGESDLAYPAPKGDPAAVQARIVLSTLFAGETNRARELFSKFSERYPDARGSLAGKTGPYRAILEGFIRTPPLPPRHAGTHGLDWKTFAGGTDRSGRVGVRMPESWVGVGRPGVPWEGSQPLRSSSGRARPRQPFGHPVVWNGKAYVSDGVRLEGFDLTTGKSGVGIELVEPPAEHTGGEVCPTLTVAEGRLYVRAGGGPHRPAGTEPTAIVCFAIQPGGAEPLRELWRLKPPLVEGKPAVWEGAPIVSGRRMWLAFSRHEGGRIVQGVACYNPADTSDEPEHAAWITEVCDTSISPRGDQRGRHELLTLANGNIVFCTNNGAIVALDSVTGHRAWAYRYPRSRKAEPNRSPHPNPVMAVGGRLFAAPTDSDRIFALDQNTGQLLWESGPADGANLLGVSAGRLIVAVSGPVPGMRGLNVATGSYRRTDGGWEQQRKGIASHGRGFVTDDVIVWPTDHGVFFLDPQREGEPIPRFPGFLSGGTSGYSGNVVYADGVLLVVTATRIFGYLSEDKLFGPPGTVSREGRDFFEHTVARAERAIAEGHPARARELLASLVRGNVPDEFRAWAAARLLLLVNGTSAGGHLPDELQGLLTPRLKAIWLFPAQGPPVTLGMLVDQQKRPLHEPSSVIEEEVSPVRFDLSPDATITRTVRLEAGTAPMRLIAGKARTHDRIFLRTNTNVQTISLDSGERKSFSVADDFTHAVDTPRGFILAGRFAIALYEVGNEPVWVFRIPATDPLPSRPGEWRFCTSFPSDPPELDCFHSCGSMLIARLGARHLLAIDLEDHRIAWIIDSQGTARYQPNCLPDEVRFEANYTTVDGVVVAQLSDGRRLFIRLDSGRILTLPGLGEQTAQVSWPTPPAEVAPHRIVVADGPGLVRMISFSLGAIRWTHRESSKRSSSLTGEPPQLRAWDHLLLVGIARNHGYELQRLNLATGKPCWPEAFLVESGVLDIESVDADQALLYVIAGKTLSAISLEDGKVVWEIHLPECLGEGDWTVKAGGRSIVVHPNYALSREPVEGMLTRCLNRLEQEPFTWRLPGMLGGLYDAWIARSLPVLLLDPETGRTLGKYTLPALGPAVTVFHQSETMVIATGSRVVWLR